MNDSKFHQFSPIIVYESTLDNQEEIKEAFYDNLSKYSFDVQSEIGFYSSGEHEGKVFLHKENDFLVFFNQLKDHLKRYMISLGFAEEKFSYHVLKSWYVIAEKNRGMNFHFHSSSDLSFVYYINLPKNSPGIEFENQNKNNINSLFDSIFSLEDHNKNLIKYYSHFHTCSSYNVNVKEGTLLIFPSSLPHSIPSIDFEGKRYSIAGDIKLTLKSDIINYEIGLMHPSNWKEL